MWRCADALRGLRTWAARFVRPPGLVAGAAVVAALAYAAAQRADAPETARVQPAELVFTVAVEGELQAVRALDIGPPVVRELWEYKIASLAPEGALVKRGEPLVAFDASVLERQLEQKQAEFDEASKRIERKQVERLSQQHDLELQLAEAESRRARARLKHEVPEELQARNEVLQTALDLKSAERQLDNLQTRIQALRSSEAAALRALTSQRDRARARLVELREAIGAMTVRAPQDGIVVYRPGWRDEKKKVGDSVWYGEKLLALPDLGEMRADGDVDESDGGALALGQSVTLRLEALPDRDLSGRVASIGRAVRRKSWRVPTKVFRVRVRLAGSDPALRPAMRFRGEIETGRARAALALPRDAVFLRPSGPVVWVRRLTGFREVPVQLGRHDRQRVEIAAGLSEGDVVAATDLATELGT